ncbi:threonine/serine exporter family protein [bacterium]|nr:threonine/serine exporter family protein [bacterium]
MTDLFIRMIGAALGVVGSAITFRLPVRAIWGCTIAGVLGWEADVALSEYAGLNSVYSSFISAMIISICCESLARALRMPATVFILPAILPLVPGKYTYDSMLHFVQGEQNQAVYYGMRAMLIASSLAVGMLFGASISRSFINPNLQHLQKSIKDDFAISIAELFDEGEEIRENPPAGKQKKKSAEGRPHGKKALKKKRRASARQAEQDRHKPRE